MKGMMIFMTIFSVYLTFIVAMFVIYFVIALTGR